MKAQKFIEYNDIFIEVRQRVAAFKYWQEYMFTKFYGMDEGDYLDEAYRFLYTSASKGFMEFCAKKEGMSYNKYCKGLGVDPEDLF